jgi:IclR family transcriptional regulator, blcABC operon repressor
MNKTPSPVDPAASTPETSRVRGRPQIVPSVIRAVRILNTLAAGPANASLASLSRRLQLPPSTALSICNSLVQANMRGRNVDGTYRLGPQVLELSRGFLNQTDLHSEFQRAVAELNVLPEQTIVCAVLRERDVVYIGRRPGTYPIGVSYEIGMRLPAHCTASGLALLSGLTDDELLQLFTEEGAGDLVTLTARSIASVPQLLDRVADIRARGYAVDNEETALGMLCVGAAVRDDARRTIGAVAVSMAKAALREREVPSIAAEVQQLAHRISIALGAPPS